MPVLTQFDEFLPVQGHFKCVLASDLDCIAALDHTGLMILDFFKKNHVDNTRARNHSMNYNDDNSHLAFS